MDHTTSIALNQCQLFLLFFVLYDAHVFNFLNHAKLPIFAYKLSVHQHRMVSMAQEKTKEVFASSTPAIFIDAHK